MTFNSVTVNITGPFFVSLVLHASDQEQYSASSVDFDLVISPHDLSLAKSALPTVNITTDQPFCSSLGSADLSGVLLDGQQVSSTNITSLVIDTSQLGGWLRYDPASKTLSGQSPSSFEKKGVLPVSLTSSFNQMLHTNVTLIAVSSFFSGDNLKSILAASGSTIDFSLAQFFSNSTGLGKNSDVNLTASFDPLQSGYFLSFDTGSAHLSGHVRLGGGRRTMASWTRMRRRQQCGVWYHTLALRVGEWCALKSRVVRACCSVQVRNIFDVPGLRMWDCTTSCRLEDIALVRPMLSCSQNSNKSWVRMLARVCTRCALYRALRVRTHTADSCYRGD